MERDLLSCNWSMFDERVRLSMNPEGEFGMSQKRYTPEQIISFLREAEVLLSQGEKIGLICRGLGVSEQSY
jgi:hypothetical protein